jgi:pimeloyl-ACP methyl ester carboxylesterase
MASANDSASDPLRTADIDWVPPGEGLTRRYASVCGFQMSYITGGQGDSIVLLHGMGSERRTWRKSLPELARHWAVYAP